MRLPVPDRSLVVARDDLRRTVRTISESPRQVIGIGLSALFLAMFTLAGIGGAFFLGQLIRTDGVGDVAVTELARGGLGLVWLGLVGFVAFRTLTVVADLEVPALSLTALSVRDLVLGLVVAESAKLALWFAPPLALLTIAFAAGARAPLLVLSVPAVALAVWLSVVPFGFAAGVAVKYVLTRFEPIARLRTPITILAFLAYFGLLFTDRLTVLVDVLYGPLQLWPGSWLADALTLAVPGLPGSLPMAVGGAVAALVVAAATWPLAVRAAALLWLSEPAGRSGGRTRTGGSRLERALAPVASRRTRAVATAVWRRALRAPSQLIFVVYPLFLLVAPAQWTVESLQATGTVPAEIPPIVMAYLVWAAGMAFTLNPLGDLGATLPTTLSAPRTGRAIVRGRVLVALAVVLVPSVVLVGGLALASTVSPVTVLTLVVGTAFGVVAATALATGIGVAFPRFGAVSVTRNREAVIPSKVAAVAYSIAVLVLVSSLSLLAYEPVWEPIATGVSALLAFVLPVDVDLPVVAVRVLGVVAFVPLAIVPWLSYRYAVRTVSGYRLE